MTTLATLKLRRELESFDKCEWTAHLSVLKQKLNIKIKLFKSYRFIWNASEKFGRDIKLELNWRAEQIKWK